MDVSELGFRAKAGTVKRAVRTFHRELMRNQTLAPGDLARLEADRAHAMARFASEESPFYRELYRENGVDVSDVLSSGDWNALPVIDRSLIKANAAKVPTSEARGRNARPALTGGSTGEPLRTMHDARVPAIALSWRMYSWWGVQPWDNIARVGRWGFGRWATIKNDVSWWPTKQIYLDAGLLSDTSMEEFVARARSTRPVLLEGYVGSMLELADFLERRGVRLDSLRAAATTAAPLPLPTRRRLEDVLGVPVFDEYRNSEINWVAGECRQQQGLHVSSDTRRLEVLDDDDRPVAPGEVGNLVLTDLTNRVFPLIRYRLGDRGALVPGECPCGVTLPLMSQPQGRTTDLIRLPSGRVIGHRLMAMFSEHPEAVRVFQVHQRRDHSIIIRVVRGGGADDERHIEAAVAKLAERIGHEVPVSIDYVEGLAAPRGKVKYVISDLA